MISSYSFVDQTARACFIIVECFILSKRLSRSLQRSTILSERTCVGVFMGMLEGGRPSGRTRCDHEDVDGWTQTLKYKLSRVMQAFRAECVRERIVRDPGSAHLL